MSLAERCKRHVESEGEYESSETTVDEWVKASDGNVPRNSVVGGQNLNGENFYVGRIMLRGYVLPGKVRMGGSVMPRNAIVGGRTPSGELLYVGRHVHKGEVTPGKVIPSHRCIYIPYLGKEIRYRDFELLVQGEYPYFEPSKSMKSKDSGQASASASTTP
ncbi:uncharacterized protein LOC8042828 isoform X2 [Ixodes scapularis]|uniref:uncharacterized protein LOC8042828 isoform X2 n=1 Tax=Ixodes scapularis TaxID=6945 RepID=UPI0011615C52|nr:uncharacterized protein LOC8042828 isoform X2 [Ixodes scapularis]